MESCFQDRAFSVSSFNTSTIRSSNPTPGCAAAKLLQSCPTLCDPIDGSPPGCPWDSPGKNTGVGFHFLLQCMKVKSQSEVAQSCPTLSDPMDCSLPGSSIHGILQARVLEWGAIARYRQNQNLQRCLQPCDHSRTRTIKRAQQQNPRAAHRLGHRRWHLDTTGLSSL